MLVDPAENLPGAIAGQTLGREPGFELVERQIVQRDRAILAADAPERDRVLLVGILQY